MKKIGKNSKPLKEHTFLPKIIDILLLFFANPKEKLPNDKLRSVQGCWNPADVIKLIKLGIDLFDTSYCYVLTERCAAMTFSIDDSDESTSYEINLRDSK